MEQNKERRTHYKSLGDISQRKAELLDCIRKDQSEMAGLWNEMFKPQTRTKKKGFSLQTAMSTGVGVIDGALFAWKLYRKFKR